MRYFLLAGALAGFPMLSGCSPTLNWRDVRPEQTQLLALFPCKPERLLRVVSLGAQEVPLTMLVCDAGGAKFALAYGNTKDAAKTAVILDQWQSTTLANIGAQMSRELPVQIKGASALPRVVAVQANGVRPDGSPVALQAVWFAAGTQVYQAAVYADTANPGVADTFFAGLRLP